MDAAALLRSFATLPATRRAGIAAAAIALVVVLCVAALAMHPARAALFANPLHPEQLAEVEERLASWSVPFTPSADNVLIDPKRRGDLLLKLSMAGVPHEHVETSQDVLGKLGALTPQGVIDAQTRDALAGDIALALRGIDGVSDARVIIAAAKPATFADDEPHAASASVRLTIAPGARLPAAEVDGIRSFVAAAVPALKASSVTILDDRGIALGGGEGDDGSDLQRQLQSALDDAVGAGTAIVRVRVEYDRRTVTSKEVRRAPVAAPAIAATTQDERYSGDGKRYDRSASQIDRGSDTREIDTAAQDGRIARISAAVFVNADRVGDLAQIRALASATLGLQSARGDTLEVQAVQFAQPRFARKDGWWLAYGVLAPALPTAFVVIAALVALRWSAPHLAGALRALERRANIDRVTHGAPGVTPAAVRGALLDEPPHAAAAIISALPAATAAAVLDMYPEAERSAIVRRMQRAASPLMPDAETYIANA